MRKKLRPQLVRVELWEENPAECKWEPVLWRAQVHYRHQMLAGTGIRASKLTLCLREWTVAGLIFIAGVVCFACMRNFKIVPTSTHKPRDFDHRWEPYGRLHDCFAAFCCMLHSHWWHVRGYLWLVWLLIPSQTLFTCIKQNAWCSCVLKGVKMALKFY